MPRIFKGTETLLKLFVPRVDEGNIETLKIGLFTDDTNNAAEFYGDNMSIDGDTVYLKVNAWSFDTMNDGVLNYIAEIEIGEETIITERQSNYFLKTPNQYVPVGPDLSDFYTKEEIDEMLEDIEVDVDLTGYATEQWVEDKTYATEQWVRRQGYVTDSDVNDYVGNEIGQLEEIINTKQDELISGTNIKTINGNNILGEGDITIEGGSGEQEVYIEEWYDRPTLEQYNRIVELLTSGKVVYHKKDKGIFPLIYSEESVLEKETTMMADNVYKYDVTSTNAVGKGIHYRYDSGFQLRGTNYKIKQPSDSGKGFVRVYHDNKGTSCPISYDATNKIATALVGENIYKWDFVNGENDGFNYFPEIIPITGGGSSSGADECIIFEFCEDYNRLSYDTLEYETIIYEGSERQTHNAECVRKIKNGEVKTAYVKVKSGIKTYVEEDITYEEPAFINVPMSFGWEYVGVYAYLTGVVKYWENGTFVYRSIALDIYEDGSVSKFELADIGEGGNSEAVKIIYLHQTELGEKVMYYYDADSMFDNTQATYLHTVVYDTDKGTQVFNVPLMGGRYENENGFENYVYAFVGDEKWTWYFPNGAQEAVPVITPIANSNVMLEATDDGVLTYSQINGIRDNWTNAYIKVHLQENLIPVDKYVAVTSLYINDTLSNNKNIHLEGICEGYLYTWDIKGSNTEGTLVRTPISAGGAAKAVVVETEKSGTVYTDILVYSKLAIIQENIGNVYIRGKLNQDSTDINDAVVTNVACHPMFDMLGIGDCKVTAMNANNIYTWTFTNKTTQVSPTITPISEGSTDLSNYYTKEETDNLIANIDIPSGGGSGDLSDYYTKSEIDTKLEGVALKSEGNTLGNYILEDTAIVALSTGYLNRQVVEKARNEYKALFVQVAQGNHPSTTKRIPVTIEAHTDSNADITGYTVWGWYSKTQTITWTFSMTNTDVHYTIE